MGSEGGGAVRARLAELVTGMRARGARVGTGEVLSAHRALAAVDPAAPSEARLALRLTLCSSRSDQAAFDSAFAAVFQSDPEAGESAVAAPPPHVAGPGQADGEEGEGEEGSEVVGAWSAARALRQKSFALLAESEREQMRLAVARLARRYPTRLTRRTRPSRRRGVRIDLRGTLRARLRAGFQPSQLLRRELRTGPRPLVFVCDVSRSMAPYSRPLLQYAQVSVAARRRVEAFVFATHLTRVTNELRGGDPDFALARAAEQVDDWESGTRIGDSLATLARNFSSRLGRGAVVVIVSDGWDRGEPERLREEMERIARCAHRVVWVNPHAADPQFEPLTRGMLAALDSVDHLEAAASLAGLEELVELIETIV